MIAVDTSAMIAILLNEPERGAMIAVDTSAVIVILRDEPERGAFDSYSLPYLPCGGVRQGVDGRGARRVGALCTCGVRAVLVPGYRPGWRRVRAASQRA